MLLASHKSSHMARRNNKGRKGKKKRVPEWQQRELEKRVVRDKKRAGKRAVARPEAGEPSVGKSKEKSKAASIAFDMVCTQECKSAKLQKYQMIILMAIIQG